MYTVLLFLRMIKKYNYYQGMDAYFRELAKVFIELKEDGFSLPSETFQELLNSEFRISSEENHTYIKDMNFRYKKVIKSFTFLRMIIQQYQLDMDYQEILNSFLVVKRKRYRKSWSIDKHLLNLKKWKS